MRFIILFTFLFLCLTANAQKRKKGIKFDFADFSKKEEVAYWLYEYDAIAWWTTDSVMTQSEAEISKLGSEWFCFQDSADNWHAVYGKFQNNKFDLVFHYLVDTAYIIKRIYQNVDTAILNTHSQALITANNKLAPLKDSFNLSFNQYIRQNADQTFTVWILPAFQQDQSAVYGGEFIYTLDKTGNKILKDDSYFSGRFLAFKLGQLREIYLNYEQLDKPTLGGIFFVWYYKKYFTGIYLNTKNSSSTVLKNERNNYYWVNIEK